MPFGLKCNHFTPQINRMKNKLLIYFILIFNLSCSQRTTIFLSKESHEYKIEDITEEGKDIVIEITLKNSRKKPVAFVLDTTTLGKYYIVNEYVFESSSKYSSINLLPVLCF